MMISLVEFMEWSMSVEFWGIKLMNGIGKFSCKETKKIARWNIPCTCKTILLLFCCSVDILCIYVSQCTFRKPVPKTSYQDINFQTTKTGCILQKRLNKKTTYVPHSSFKPPYYNKAHFMCVLVILRNLIKWWANTMTLKLWKPVAGVCFTYWIITHAFMLSLSVLPQQGLFQEVVWFALLLLGAKSDKSSMKTALLGR